MSMKILLYESRQYVHHYEQNATNKKCPSHLKGALTSIDLKLLSLRWANQSAGISTFPFQGVAVTS